MRRIALVSGLLLLLASGDASAQRTGGRFGGSRSFGSSRSGSSGSSYRGSSSYGSSYRSSSSYRSGSSYRSTSNSGTSGSTSSSYSYQPTSGPPWLTAVQHVRAAASFGTIVRIRVPLVPPPSPREDRVLLETLDRIEDPPRVSYGAAVGAFVFTPLALVTLLATGRRKTPRNAAPDGSCTVRRISVAFDWTERARLQNVLDVIAAAVDTSSVDGLFHAARHARDTIANALRGARYAMFQSIALPPAKAEAEFARQAKSLGERFGQLTVMGRARVAGPEGLVARREEGQGFVVVSLVVASNTQLPPLPEHLDSNAVAQALAQLLPAHAEHLVGLEVVWSPSEGEDRLSSAELEAVYPELLPLQGAEALGRVSCGYCHAIYARELLHCPACGANDPRTSRAATTGYATIACRYCGRQTPSYEVQCQHCGARAAN